MPAEGRGFSAALGKLPRFNGSSSVARFLSQFKKRAALEDIAEDKKADILRFLLDGPAEIFLASHSELETAGLQELENRLKERFTPKMTSAEGLTRLMQVRQEDRLTEEYAERIEQEAADLIEFVPDLRTEGTREELLIQAFINGLRQELKIQLSAPLFTKFRDAVTAAKKVEQVSQELLQVNAVIKRQDNHTGKSDDPGSFTTGQGRPRRESATELGAEQYYDPAPTIAFNTVRQPFQPQWGMQPLQPQWSQPYGEHFSVPRHPSNFGRSYGSPAGQSTPRGPQCFTCQGYGHLSRDCANRRSARSDRGRAYGQRPRGGGHQSYTRSPTKNEPPLTQPPEGEVNQSSH